MCLLGSRIKNLPVRVTAALNLAREKDQAAPANTFLQAVLLPLIYCRKEFHSEARQCDRGFAFLDLFTTFPAQPIRREEFNRFST